jgi:hypothetical protein
MLSESKLIRKDVIITWKKTESSHEYDEYTIFDLWSPTLPVESIGIIPLILNAMALDGGLDYIVSVDVSL